MGLIAVAYSLMALRRDPIWVDLAEDDDDSDMEWYESDGVLDTLLPESWCVKATLKGEKFYGVQTKSNKNLEQRKCVAKLCWGEVRNALLRPMKIQRNSKVTLKEQRIRTRREDGTQTLQRCGLLCSLKNRSRNIGLGHYKPSLKAVVPDRKEC